MTPGYQTTEFWLAIALLALVVLNGLFDLGLDAGELISAGLAVAGYSVGRGQAKRPVKRVV